LPLGEANAQSVAAMFKTAPGRALSRQIGASPS
jgi:hypothetical protein